MLGMQGGHVTYRVATSTQLPGFASPNAAVRRRFRDFVVRALRCCPAHTPVCTYFMGSLIMQQSLTSMLERAASKWAGHVMALAVSCKSMPSAGRSLLVELDQLMALLCMAEAGSALLLMWRVEAGCPAQALADLLKATHRGYFIPPRPEKNPVEGQRASQARLHSHPSLRITNVALPRSMVFWLVRFASRPGGGLSWQRGVGHG